MEEYIGGKIIKGNLYRVAFADIWQAQRDIANAQALPRNGIYWKHWAIKEAYDEILELKEEITRLTSYKPPVGVRTIDMAKEYSIGLQDSTQALMRFREENQANYETHLELNFPAEFSYTNNRFLFGLISYTCNLNGGRWKVDYAGSDEKLQRAIFAGSIFHTNTLEYVGKNEYHYGFKIKTAEKGDTAVYLKEPSNIKSGERCLIYGFDHIIGDDPPGTKYHDWIEIKSIVGDKLILSEPLQHRYDERWMDFPNVRFGKPRIISLDRIDYKQPKRAELVGGTITGSLQILADNVFLNDLIVEDYFWPALSRNTIAIDCHFKGGVELDKVGGTLLCYNCTFDKHVTNGTGFDFIGLYDCTFKEGYEICPREYEVLNPIIISDWKEDIWYAPVSEPPAQSAVSKATFGRHIITRSPDNRADKAFNLKVKKTYKVVKVQDGNIVIPYKHTTGDEWSSLIRCQDINETEILTLDGRKGKVTNIIEGENNAVIALWEGDEIREGDVIYWYPLREVVDLGNHEVSKDFSHGLKPQII